MSLSFVIFGMLLVFSGVASIFNPFTSAVSTGIFMGVLVGTLFIANGINGLFFDRKKKSFWSILLDILMILLGLSVIFSDTGILRVSTFLVIYFGVATMFAGTSRIVLAFQIKKAGLPWGWVLVSGILSVLCSILILSNPLTGLLAFDYMLSIMTIVLGINMLSVGINCK